MRRLEVDDFYRIRYPIDPALSPDARTVAYVDAEVDRAGYRYRRTIWLVDIDGGNPRRLTDGEGDSGPLFSPDGQWIAFTRTPPRGTRAGSIEEAGLGAAHAQLFVVPAGGGDARQLTWLPRGAAQATWAPDSSGLVCTSETGDPDDAEAATAEVTGADIPRVRTIDTMTYRLDGRGFIYEWRSHLFRAGLDGSVTQLTDGDHNDASARFSPDGARLAFVSDRAEERWRWPGGDIWILNLSTGAEFRVTDESLACGQPAWIGDGTRLGFPAARKRRSAGHVDVFVAEASAGASLRCLTAEFEGTCRDVCIDDQRNFDESNGTVDWNDRLGLVCLASRRGATQVCAFDSNGGQPRALTVGDHHVYAAAMDREGHFAVVAVSDPCRPGDLDVVSLDDGESRRLLEFNPWLGSEVAVTPLAPLAVTAPDGQQVGAWVLRAPTVAGTMSGPAVLEIHGGPATMYGHSFNLEFQLLAASGVTVVLGNPRGSTGYGREFSAALHDDWGGVDTIDLMAILDAAIATGGIDPRRVGVAGGSYGGYMTNWLVGHTDRFAAAVAMRSVANQLTMFGMSDVGWLLTVDEMSSTPWDGEDLLRQRSPVTYVENIHTPLLLLHSEQDLRCPIGEAEQMFMALKYLGREVRLVRFEGQGHELSRSGHPRSRTVRLELILEWFREHLSTARGS